MEAFSECIQLGKKFNVKQKQMQQAETMDEAENQV